MKRVAYYLPQFHEIAENNEWWGDGFTEWTNVARAVPQFAGHRHPRIPAHGEYDLRDVSVFVKQTSVARAYGIDAFCMYFYWFDGKRLLEEPLEAYRQNPDLLPYCLSWANESWTRRWDGKDHEVLMPQNYGVGFEEDVFKAWLPHLQAPHYLRNDGLPVVVLHRPDLVPNLSSVVRSWRELAKQNDLPGLYLVGAETKLGLDPAPFGLDAVAEFPPVGANTFSSAQFRPIRGVNPEFKGRLLSYKRLARRFVNRPTPRFARHRGVTPRWDNTARRQGQATIYVGSTPALFRQWLLMAEADEARLRGVDGLLFINAWNEWAEGAYLEEDLEYGDAYLRALSPEFEPEFALAGEGAAALRYAFLPGRSQVRSWVLLSLGSALGFLRRVRFKARSWWSFRG